MTGTSLESENADLLKFIYACPAGIADVAVADGSFGLVNPHAMQLLLPIARGGWVDDFFLIMEPYAPELRGFVETFSADNGIVCENHRVFVDEMRVLSCTLVKLGAARCILTITDVSGQVAQERRLEQALRAKADIVESELLKVTALNADLDQLSRHLSEARDRAEQADRAKSRFLAGMSHELRTPLNAIMGYAHLLHIEGGLNTVQEARVDAMLGSGRHLIEMIACVLDLSEIEAERVTLRPAEVDPGAIAAACLDLVGPLAKAKSLTTSLVIPPGFIKTVVLDPTRLRQILLNLLGNALKFTLQGSVLLRLSLLQDTSTVLIEVADTGPGIAADQRQRLFQDFERLDVNANASVEGAGLGLAISSRIAALMGGKLGHSENPGGGSIFWLELPLETPSKTLLEPAPSSERSGARRAPLTHPLKVLVVDDVHMNRDIAGSFLRAGGYEVAFADSGAQAVAAAASADLGCVLMDVRMPGMDGMEATRRIRLLEGERGRVPIVALTAQAFIDQIAKCREAGMDSHLSKPFDPDTLLTIVAQAIEIGFSRRLNHDGASATTGAAVSPAHPVMGMDLPLLNLTVFDQTAGFLKAETLASYLETIVAVGHSVLLGLRGREAGTSDDKTLAETAHKLAGSAGMFGFERVAHLCRRFERALQTATTDEIALATALRVATEASFEDGHLLERGSGGWMLVGRLRGLVRTEERCAIYE